MSCPEWIRLTFLLPFSGNWSSLKRTIRSPELGQKRKTELSNSLPPIVWITLLLHNVHFTEFRQLQLYFSRQPTSTLSRSLNVYPGPLSSNQFVPWLLFYGDWVWNLFEYLLLLPELIASGNEGFWELELVSSSGSCLPASLKIGSFRITSWRSSYCSSSKYRSLYLK